MNIRRNERVVKIRHALGTFGEGGEVVGFLYKTLAMSETGHDWLPLYPWE